MLDVRVAELGDPADVAADGDRPLLSGQTQISRRRALGGGLAGLAGLGGLMLFPGQLLAKEAVANDPLIILLKGTYKPATNPPNLSLSSVKLNDGSYSTVKIYPVKGVPGNPDPKKAFGNFFVGTGDLCAYNLPKGSMAMRFEPFDIPAIPDGSGGNWLVGNAGLKIIEGTGIYRSFVGGRNFMVDILHQLPDNKGFVENCVCIISRP
jgi:hypothetical protein